MTPRIDEQTLALKSLSVAFQELDDQYSMELKLLKENYLLEAEKVASLIEQNPKKDFLLQRKEKLSDTYEQSLNNLLNDHKEKKQKIQQEIYELMVNQESKINHVEFKNEFRKTLNFLDNELIQRAAFINRNAETNVLEEVQKIDIFVFNTVNKLAKYDVLVKIDQAKVALMMSLCPFMNYDLEKAQLIAHEIINHIAECYMANKKISYELLAKNLEKTLNLDPANELFVDLLKAIKEPCTVYFRHKEFLYTNLYNAKKLEFQQRLRDELKLVDQDQARIQIEQSMLEHLLRKKTPKDFYLTMVRLGIDEVNAKRRSLEQNDEQCLVEFKQHQKEVLEQLNTELNHDLLDFIRDNEMTLPAIKLLNISEVQTMYMRIAMLGTVPAINDKDEYYSLTTKEILQAFNEEEQKLSGKKTIHAELESNDIHKPLSKLDSYHDKIQHDKFNQFKIVIKFERDPNLLNHLKNNIEFDSSKRDYLDAINDRLQQLSQDQRIHRRHMLIQPPVLSPLPTEVETQKKVLAK